MANRRNRADVGDHDSVLDTMTNVVGILVIVAAVTQLNVSSAVGRAQATLGVPQEAIDHPPVPPAELAGAQREHDAVRGELAGLTTAVAQEDAEQALSEAEWADLAERLRVATPAKSPAELREEAAQLQRKLSDLETESAWLQGQIARSASEIAELERRLEMLKGRRAAPPSAARMRLPDPSASRAAGRDVVPFVVKGGQVFEWDRRSVLASWERERDAALAFIPPSVIGTEAKLRWLADSWNRADYGNGTLRLRFRVEREGPGDWDLRMVEELVPGAVGSTLAEIQSGKSRFHRALSPLAPARHWIFFHAYDDSFESYVAARAHAEDRGFDVGWLPYGPGQRLERSLTNSAGGQPALPD